MGDKMKKKLKYLIYTMCFALLFLVNTTQLNASDDHGGGGTGQTDNSCKTGWCTGFGLGFRITIVDKETGKRCNYDPATGEMCRRETDSNKDGKLDEVSGSGTLPSVSYDYWWKSAKDEGLGNEGNTAYFTTGNGNGGNNNKPTKLEILGKNDLKGSSSSNGLYGVTTKGPYLKMDVLGLPLGAWDWYEEWSDRWITDTASWYQPQNMNFAIIKYLNCQQQPDKDSSYCKNYPVPNYTVFNNIFTRSFYGYGWVAGRTDGKKQIDAAALPYWSVQNTFILFEQDLVLRTWNQNNRTLYMAGSVTEVMWMCDNGVGEQFGYYSHDPYNPPTACNYILASVGPQKGWNINLSTAAQEKSWPVGDGDDDRWSSEDPDSLSPKLPIGSSIASSTLKKFYQRKDTISLLNFWFTPDPCATALQKSLQRGDKDLYDSLEKDFSAWGDERLWFVKHYTYEQAKFLYDHTENKGFNCGSKITCGQKARAIYDACGKNPGDRCTISKDERYGSYEEALIAWSKDDVKGEQMITEANYEQSEFHTIYMKTQRRLNPYFYPEYTSNGGTGCPIVQCVQDNVNRVHKIAYKNRETDAALQADYKEYFNWLHNAVSKFYGTDKAGQDTLLLLERWWTVVGRDGPRCEEIINCPANEDIDNTCESENKNIVLEDYVFGENNEEAIKCWQKGFAYTNLDANGNQTGIVGSWAKKVGSGNDVCNLYCSEQVKFSLPGEVGTGTDDSDNPAIRAGTIFKWGLKRDTKNNVLGTITFTKKCVVRQDNILLADGSQYKPNCSNIRVDYSVDDWIETAQVGDRNTTQIDYVDPLEEYQYSDVNHDVSIDWLHPVQTQDIVGVTCGNNDPNCDKYLTPDDLTTYATYNIVYHDPLNWYGNKSTGEPEAKQDIVKKPAGSKGLPWYKWLGYGLPTAFMTPNGTYGADWVDKNGNGDGKFDGLLKLTFDHLGTKTNINGKAGISTKDFGDEEENNGAIAETHFDMLLQKVFGSTKLKYGCPFRIINELFGNDCKYEEDSMGNLVLTDDSPAYCDPKDDDKVESGDPDPNDDPDNPYNRRRYIRDIDVVFRVIDLISSTNITPNKNVVDNAFPGILGTGRIRGRNWAKLTDSEVEDVLSEDIYRKEPMYSLELNTTNIRYIRELNRQARSASGTYNAADPYTEMRMFDNDNDIENISNLPGYIGYYCVNYSGLNATTDTSIEGQDVYKYCASRFLSLLANDTFKNDHGGTRLEGSCVGHNSTARSRALAYVKPDKNGNFVGCPRN